MSGSVLEAIEDAEMDLGWVVQCWLATEEGRGLH